jgi:uncharacterized protein (DUF1697 family)
MTVFVALLRAVNVGGTGMLPMKELQSLFLERGLKNVRTYIQSGNVVFESVHDEARLKADLELALTRKMGKGVAVLIRTSGELQAVLDANPFPSAAPARVGVVFLSEPAPSNLLEGLKISGREELHLAGREIFIHYPDGMGRSKLKLPPLASNGTSRNINTVARLVAMTSP